MVYDVFVPNWSAEVDMAAAAKLLQQESEKLGKPALNVESFVEGRFLEENLRG
jgi:hypothetical protein